MSNILKGRVATKGTLTGGLAAVFGKDGKSAYDVAVMNGYEGTEAEWLESLNGEDGENGKSAYEIAVYNGFEGTEEEWLESLKGESGVYLGSGEMPEDCNVQIDPDGSIFEGAVYIDTHMNKGIVATFGSLTDGVVYHVCLDKGTPYPFTDAHVYSVITPDTQKETQFAYSIDGKIYSRCGVKGAMGTDFTAWECVIGDNGGSGTLSVTDDGNGNVTITIE